MHFQQMIRFVGILVFFLGISMIGPLIVSFAYHDGAAIPLTYALAITLGFGLVIYGVTKKEKDLHLSHRDGAAMVTFGWAAAGLVGALPFLTTGSIPGFTDAYFESLSGFTTTGASVLEDIEALPAGILLWRSIIQWFGGMGIIVLSIAILPFLGIAGMQLYKAEIPSPVVDKLKPRISDTAKVLWKVYLLLTTLNVAFLIIGGMPIFEAACHAFCTMPTGGFSPRNISIAYYASPYVDGVIVLFMLLSGINFSLHFRFLRGEFSIFGKDPECRAFITLVVVMIILVTLNIYGTVFDSLAMALRYAAFQVSSLITTTGFVTADYNHWPPLSHWLLLICMFLGAMAGSTGGGLKTMRVLILAKHAYREIFQIINPHAVSTVKLGGKPVSSEIIGSIWGFFFLYLVLFVISVTILSLLGLDLITAFSAVAACIFNVGPGLGLVGPVENYAAIPLAGKWVLIFSMLLGRLEVYTVVVLFAPAFWRR
jgi:trk system potassium uptake protein TrkH